MGICKCKKRSEDFCFNHKKFICDSCVVADHPVVMYHSSIMCYIKSYVDWLTDCEFEDSVCGVCKGRFDADDSEDSVRLGCYHLFHPECIDVYVATLSQNSTPASYPCPKCSEPILPPNDKQSPLANMIRDKFSLSSWCENYLNTFKINNNNNNNGNNNINGNNNSNSKINGTQHSNLSHTHTHSNNNNISPNQSTSEFYTNLDQIKNNNTTMMNGHHHHNTNGIINPNLLEETPPLSHLNPNLYGLASRKHEDTVIQLNGLNSNINNNMSGHQIYDEDSYDKYNKRTVNPFSKLINTIKETKTKYLVMIAIGSIIFLIILMRINSSNSDDINTTTDDVNIKEVVKNNIESEETLQMQHHQQQQQQQQQQIQE